MLSSRCRTSWHDLVFHNQRILYDLLFRASAATLLEVAADPKHLGAEIGFLSVLHTWGQTLQFHPHVHCVIPSGGLAPDHQQWIRPRYPFFLPVQVLSTVFRGKFVAGLKRAWRARQLCLPGPLQPMTQEKMFRSFVRSLYRATLGRLCQATLRRDRNTFSTIWPATRIGWQSPTTGWSTSSTAM